jgi:DUF4097 and DUF4098 domain-containing protein YvlB
MENFVNADASLSSMKMDTSQRRWAHADGPALWIALAAGLLLMLLAAAARAGGEESKASRTDSFSATLPPGSSLKISNVSGDITAHSGRQFSATATITVAAATQERANELLSKTTVSQSREDSEYRLETLWPFKDQDGRAHHRAYGHNEMGCRDCKITVQYDITVPAGVRVNLHTVNGEVRAKDLDGDLDLQTVNGGVVARGARRSITAHSVNGKVDVASEALPAEAALDLKTVNGAVLVTLPRDAKFQLSASSMNGVIASTFALPPRLEGGAGDVMYAPAPPAPPASPRKAPTPRPAVVERDGDDEDVVVDLHDLERELEQSMRQIDVEVERSVRNSDREVRHVRLSPGGSYTGAIGQAGAGVHVSTLNGPITVLASGTRESDAKVLVSPRRSFSMELPYAETPRVEVRVPRVDVRIPKVVIPKSDVHVESGSSDDEDEVVRGDVNGDFLATSGGRSYKIGNVSGRVKILTHAGEIHLGSVGAGAELKTYGGDITIGPVRGDLKAVTLAGDVRAGAVSGSVTLDTSGGDVRVERIGGSAQIRTGGGDIILPAVVGAVQAASEGGSVRIALLSREPKGGVVIRNAGGDVTLTLPGDVHADVELAVDDSSDAEETFIRSDFPEIAVVRRSDSVRASGALNGGGPRISVRTTSGTIRLRKAAAAAQ